MYRKLYIGAVLAVTIESSTPAIAADLSYLQGLLAATPEGGWVQVNVNNFADAWPTGLGALPPGTYSDPARVVTAWSSFAWDSTRGDLLLFGGGHANYMGNEVYVWKGSTGMWTRGSLPSRIEQYNTTSIFYTVDNAAPVSAHTYDNQLYVPVNDLFVTFGGAAFNSGGSFFTKAANGQPIVAGPWMWDPSKADPSKVGGTTGSGYDPSIQGGQMWSNQRGQWTGSGPIGGFVETNSAYRQENGKDVIYVTSDINASGRQTLNRYELGNVRAGEIGKFEQVGIGDGAVSFQSAAAIDSAHGLYIRTSAHKDFYDTFQGFGVWDLSKNNANNPSANNVKYINLTFADGSIFAVSKQDGITFDDRSGKILLWDGKEGGTVYETEALFDSSGAMLNTWIVNRRTSSTGAHPSGNYMADIYNESGVLGKFEYIDELGAVIVLDQWNPATQDAGVWLYKPFVSAVPEPEAFSLFLIGLGLVGVAARRNSRQRSSTSQVDHY